MVLKALWHSADANKIIGGSQFNGFQVTSNGGASWSRATQGIDDNGPFRTRLSHHKRVPDRIFTVGSTGIWRSDNFGLSWSPTRLNQNSGWAFANNIDVEVAYSNPSIVWTGAYMQQGYTPFVSTDAGLSFTSVNSYAENMGNVSGIGTHPTKDSTAYILFSFAGRPKVLRTEDLGNTWTDISGFDGSGDRGFPDVAVNTIFVFPTDENKIWVGSEIGIVESLDNGQTWGLLDANIPPVNVYDFKLSENVLVIATYGRGIWSYEVEGVTLPSRIISAYTHPSGKINLKAYIVASDSSELYIENDLVLKIGARK